MSTLLCEMASFPFLLPARGHLPNLLRYVHSFRLLTVAAFLCVSRTKGLRGRDGLSVMEPRIEFQLPSSHVVLILVDLNDPERGIRMGHRRYKHSITSR